MKKILLIIGQLGIGGAERQMLYLASNLDLKKYQVKVCSFSADTSLLSLLEVHNIDIVALPKSGNPDLSRPFKLFKLVREFQPDIIHSYLFVANTWSRIIGAFLKVPVILSERNSQPTKPKWQKRIDRLLSPFGSLLIANSQSGARRVIEYKEFNPIKVRVVYNGIPLEEYQKEISKETKSQLKTEMGIPDSAKVVGVVGRLNFQKNHELLFESFQLIKNQIPEMYLLCIGEGPRKKELEKLASELGIHKQVIFTGVREDIPECLSIMDVLVLASRWEGLPNVILEAMAAKCPVVATKVGGVDEIIKDNQTGLLVENENKEKLAIKIEYAINNQVEVEQITRNAFEFVKSNFSIKKMVDETEKIYEDILVINGYKKKLIVLVGAHIGYPVGGISINYENLLASDLNKIVDLKFVETSKGNLSFDNRGSFHVSNFFNVAGNIINFIFSVIKFKPNIIHIGTAYGWSLWKHAFMGLLSHLLGYKFILQFHFNYEKFPSPISFRNKILLKFIGLSSGFIVLSNDWLSIGNIFPGKSMKVIPNAIETMDYQKIDLIEKNKDNHKVNVLYLGHIGKDKGVFDLLETFIEILRNQNFDVYLDYFGESLTSGDYEKLEVLINSSGFQKNINIHKPVYGEEKIKVFSNSHILVLPSYHEGMPISIIEAMAAGIPVIASTVGGIPDQVVDGKTGLLINPGNVDELSDALIKLIENPELRLKMGNEGRQRANEIFDISIKVEKLYDFYSHVLVN